MREKFILVYGVVINLKKIKNFLYTFLHHTKNEDFSFIHYFL